MAVAAKDLEKEKEIEIEMGLRLGGEASVRNSMSKI